MRSFTLAAICILTWTLVGCGDPMLAALDGATAEAAMAQEEENAIQPNAIQPNAIQPNAIQPNAIQPNALAVGAIPPGADAALRDPGEVGALSRMFLRYAIACAFSPSQSFSFSWTDSLGIERPETYVGSMGLAPSWATGPLDEAGQRWVSACLAARTNLYGVPVLISMRGSHGGIKVPTTEEKFVFTKEEGAFWGNLFAPTPTLYACAFEPNVENSRLKLRACAAGHVGEEGIEDCGVIERRGSCEELCDPLHPGHQYHPQCTWSEGGSPQSTTAVITVFLP